ncbi:MAG: hypothetical protein NT008_07945 [Methylococcales bacterium]|nr:hypothetical protein [Methylococcales bacterium]
MSNEENAKPEETIQAQPQEINNESTTDQVKNTVGNLLSSFLSLKETNPKVFFGSIAGVTALLVLLMSTGGNSSKPALSGPKLVNLAIGQRYSLKSANAYDPSATVRLVSTPGAIAAYDDTEEADRSGACQHIPQGTQVSVLEFADAFGKQNAYAKVRVEDGDCKGNESWALAIDIQ